ncbi:MAG TPA: hypothetical protein PLX97_08380 [Gemmatales bacterium]|nr:hypothetical protein [Gemmatales bacterium]
MNTPRNTSRDSLQRCWDIVSRLLWAGLFLIHLIPLATVVTRLVAGPSLYLVLSLAAILGIMSVALLKAIDVPLLRFPLSFRKCCTLIILGLFFHGDVVAKKLPDIMVVESTMYVLVALVAANRKVRCAVLKLVQTTGLQLRESMYACVEELAPTPLVPVHVLLAAPRPPPAQR